MPRSYHRPLLARSTGFVFASLALHAVLAWMCVGLAEPARPRTARADVVPVAFVEGRRAEPAKAPAALPAEQPEAPPARPRPAPRRARVKAPVGPGSADPATEEAPVVAEPSGP